MSHRVNVMLDDEVWQALQEVPKGERSRAVNRALEDWFRHESRRLAARGMDASRKAMPAVRTREIVAWLREQRERQG